jgi:hypothetical protein
MAMGLTIDAVPPSSFSGATTSMNSHRERCAHA